jgi:peroxiredoxin
VALLVAGLVLLTTVRAGGWGGQSAPPADRPAAPDFAIATVGGGRFALAEQRGKPVVVYFMAGWCTSCVPEAQALARLHREYRNRGLEVLVVDVEAGETEADLAGFQRWVGPAEYTWAIDRTGALVRAFQVRALDTTVVIDREGRVAYRDGVPTPDDLLKRVVAEVL